MTTRSKPVEDRTLTFWEKLYLPAIVGGLSVTIKHFFKRKQTIKYPEQVRQYSPVYRGLHVLKRDENGAERCTACGLCAIACPAEAITMIAAERQPGEEHLYREEKYAKDFKINMLRCIFCGLCEEACPKEAIFLTNRTVASEYLRAPFIYGKDLLVEPVDKDKRIDVSKRQTKEVIEFKKHKEYEHNML